MKHGTSAVALVHVPKGLELASQVRCLPERAIWGYYSDEGLVVAFGMHQHAQRLWGCATGHSAVEQGYEGPLR